MDSESIHFGSNPNPAASEIEESCREKQKKASILDKTQKDMIVLTQMSSSDYTAQPLKVNNIDELISLEPQIVERINITPNGGRLFMADPIRLLKEINVNLSPKATRQLEKKLGVEDLALNPLRRLYDDFKRDTPDNQPVSITINGVIPKGGGPNAG